ncbi:MAG TPA: CatB-related O-acetyltransferase [Acidimicrobiales bacterium]|nr:CatB-related O-acetyltransferase [Acidimicrobiales bacterium]
MKRKVAQAVNALLAHLGLRLSSTNWKHARFEELKATGRVQTGAYAYGIPTIMIYEGDTARVVIGAYTSIASQVTIFVGGNHRPDWVSTFPFRAVLKMAGAFQDGLPASKGDVVIGSDVWIGHGATILSGSTVGHGAVIGAKAVVAGPIRPYAIAVGNPAREVRRRFSDEIIEALLAIEWWNWPIERVRDFVPLFCSPDVEEFLKKASGDNANTSST